MGEKNGGKSEAAVRAHSKLNYRVRLGLVRPPQHCERCGKRKKLEAHHSNYNRPYDVRWLCAHCHHEVH